VNSDVHTDTGRSMRNALLWPALFALLGGACGKDAATTPSTTTSTTTTTAGAPSITDSFSGQLDVRGAAYFDFAVTQYGTVNATLLLVSGPGVPSTVQLRLGIGSLTETTTDDGTFVTCTPTTTALAKAGSTPQVTATLDVGMYCVSVADVGNLYGPADFSLAVAHP
jgi:hypothetical protein